MNLPARPPFGSTNRAVWFCVRKSARPQPVAGLLKASARSWSRSFISTAIWRATSSRPDRITAKARRTERSRGKGVELMDTYIIREGRGVPAPVQDLHPQRLSANFRFPVGRGVWPEGLNLRVSMPAILEKDFAFSVDATGLLLFGIRR